MLNRNEETLSVAAHTVPRQDIAETAATAYPHDDQNGWLARALRVEWLGQMAASLCWIASVLTYGISSGGDWLQLAAACSWLVANVASLMSPEDK